MGKGESAKRCGKDKIEAWMTKNTDTRQGEIFRQALQYVGSNVTKDKHGFNDVEEALRRARKDVPRQKAQDRLRKVMEERRKKK